MADKNTNRFATMPEILKEYETLEAAMADPSIHSDQGKARQLGKRYAQLGPVIAGYRAYKKCEDDLTAARELAADDESFASEIPALEKAFDDAAATLEELLLPRDPNDDRDVILEIKAGAGGEESALFAGDLLRMYLRYAEKQGWKTEIIDATESDLGGYKDISVAVKSRGNPEPGRAPFAKLKFEGGVHRVQRVPETESQGRIHTWLLRVAAASASAASWAAANKRARKIRSADSLFCSWLFSFWQETTIPVGRWVIRTAESVVLTL